MAIINVIDVRSGIEGQSTLFTCAKIGGTHFGGATCLQFKIICACINDAPKASLLTLKIIVDEGS